MQKLTKEQAIVIMGYTGITVCNNFGDFQEDVEKRLGRGVWTHEFASKEFTEEIHALYKPDFLKLIPEE